MLSSIFINTKGHYHYLFTTKHTIVTQNIDIFVSHTLKFRETIRWYQGATRDEVEELSHSKIEKKNETKQVEVKIA